MITRELTLMLIVALLIEAKQNLNSPDVIKIVNSANQGWRAGQIKKFDNATSDDTSLLLGLIPETPNPSLVRNPNRKRATNAVTLPEYFDARSKWPKCTQPVRSQDSCGCCWAFASSSVFSWRMCIQTAGAINSVMSVQYPVSCNKVNSACNGGGISSTWTWYAQYGEMLDVDYPYTSGDSMVAGTCFSTTGKRKFYAASHEWLTSITDMMEEIYLNGPIQVGMDVYYDFFTYKSGVYSHVTGDLAGGHSVYLVGWGVDGYGKKYWTAVNSWGDTWGVSGSFQIKRGTNECKIESGYAVVAPILVVPSTTKPPTTTAKPTVAPTTAKPTTKAPTTTTTKAATTAKPTAAPTTPKPATTTAKLTTAKPTTAPPTTPKPTTTKPPATCPPNWQTFGTKCIIIPGATSTQANAKANCIGLGGTLATITSDNMNNFLSVIKSTTVTENLFIGVEVKNGKLVDLNGAPVTYAPLSGTIGVYYMCVVQIRDPNSPLLGKWKTEDCKAVRPFVCIKNA